MVSEEFYRCEVCGRIVESYSNSRSEPPVCHGKPMAPMEFKGEGHDGAEEHELGIFEEDGRIYVEVGVVPHEMTEDSRIVWIEIVSVDSRVRKYLMGEVPGTTFDRPEGDFEVRILCSKHGVWKFNFEQAGEDLRQAVEKAVERFNSLRSPEAKAAVLEIRGDLIKVEFTGNFCRTCGFYDYFEDFRLALADSGVKARTVEIDEFEDGAVVTYKLGDSGGDGGPDQGSEQAKG